MRAHGEREYFRALSSSLLSGTGDAADLGNGRIGKRGEHGLDRRVVLEPRQLGGFARPPRGADRRRPSAFDSITNQRRPVQR